MPKDAQVDVNGSLVFEKIKIEDSGTYNCMTRNKVGSMQAAIVILAQACGNSVSAPIGTFKSPGYPSKYTNDIRCRVTITVAKSSRVRLTMHAFATEGCCDKLEIRQVV
eukprot:gene19522-21452_t